MPESPETDYPPVPHKGVRPRVLVIDDDTEFLELAQTALAESGLDVVVAHTAGEGLVQAVRMPPDLILLDIMLPGQDGIDLLDALRAEPETRGIPIFACTALGERDSGLLLPQIGFDGLVAKPADLREVGKAILHHLAAKTEG